MTTTRREFIRNASLIGTGLLVGGNRGFSMKSSSGGFLDRIGICTSITKSHTPAVAGYAYIEEGVRNFLIPQDDEAAFEKKRVLLQEAMLPVEACNSFLPGELKSVGPEAVHDEILKFAETAFRRASVAGVKTIVFGSGGSRTIPDGYSRKKAEKQFVALGKRLGDEAGRYGVVISLEPLNKGECNFINSVSEGGELVNRIDHPNFRLLADIYHMKMEDESPEHLIECGPLLYHLHIAEKEGRSAPGVHGEDFTPYFAALKKAGFTGRLSIECRWEDQEDQAPGALRALRAQIPSA